VSLAPQTSFEGFARPDGRRGSRNHVLVLPTVICSHVVAEEIADRSPSAVATPHDHGCAQIGADNNQTRRTFLGLCDNPNVAGVLVVGLGCEALQSDGIVRELERDGAPVRESVIQDAGGTEPCIERGLAAVEELASGVRTASRTAGDLGDLMVGVVATDCNPTTLGTADPLVGTVVEEVVDAGGRAVVAGTDRVLPHADALRSRLQPAARAEFEAFVDRHRDLPARATRVRRDALESEPDAVARLWSDLPFEEVLEYGEQAGADAGMSLLDAPARFAEAATGLVAAGAQVIVHATGEGIPTGHPVVPTIKVTGDPTTYDALERDIDVDARNADAADVLNLVGRVASGDPTCAEENGLTDFAITRIGPSM
jgi:altronate dehydratase large subunit